MARASQAVTRFAEDMEFSRRTAAALEKYEKHPESFKKYTAEQFLRELKKW